MAFKVPNLITSADVTRLTVDSIDRVAVGLRRFVVVNAPGQATLDASDIFLGHRNRIEAEILGGSEVFLSQWQGSSSPAGLKLADRTIGSVVDGVATDAAGLRIGEVLPIVQNGGETFKQNIMVIIAEASPK